ncbi:hypothetical protein B0H34DRAFT_843889 [Crassisporium funariophilum]|nr:hypothetical protein B0H34DRAFT_843889 [Crassisporium funariophilum]
MATPFQGKTLTICTGPLTPSGMATESGRHTRLSTLLLAQRRSSAFKGSIHYAPYMQYDKAGQQIWLNLLSVDAITETHGDAAKGVMFVPVVAGSDKMTVFVQQMYHACLTCVFKPLKAGMSIPKVVHCPDGHLRHAFFGLGPYIADYPEQVWLAGIVQGWCPKCDAHPKDLDAPEALHRSHAMSEVLIMAFDPGTLWDEHGIRTDVVPFTHHFPCANIHELLSPDLLHQVIKGTFKDHLVLWVGEYLWTADVLKALMKVYLSIHQVYLTAIIGYVPSKMVQCMSAFLDFCYLARRNAFLPETLNHFTDALQQFHLHRNIFVETLSQMLWTILQMEKLFKRGMMTGSTSPYMAKVYVGIPDVPEEDENEDDKNDNKDLGPASGPKVLLSIKLARQAETQYPCDLVTLAMHIQQRQFPEALRRFLWGQLNPNSDLSPADVSLNDCPILYGQISVFHSAVAHYFAPSDVRGAGGMHHKHICTHPSWHGEYPRYNTAFAETDVDLPGMEGMTVAHVLIPDPNTGLWVVWPKFDTRRRRTLEVVHLDSIVCAAHLLPVYGSAPLPKDFHFGLS